MAFWPDAEKIISGAIQAGSPDVILESTPNGAQGYFYDSCMDALRGDSVWTIHFYPWWWESEYFIPLEDGEYLTLEPDEHELSVKHGLTHEQIKWRRYKQRELRKLFIQEYPEDPITCFLTSGNSYFGDIADMFTANPNASYDSRHEYYAGLDWGQSVDYTAMIVIDATAAEMVDYLYVNKLEWAEQRKRIAEVAKRWNCIVHAESNSIGGVNIEELARLGVTVVPFDTNNESKQLIMSALHEALHGGLKLIDWGVLRHELNTFVSTQLPGELRLAADGAWHDDTVIALALAWYAARVMASLRNSQKSRIVYDPVQIGNY